MTKKTKATGNVDVGPTAGEALKRLVATVVDMHTLVRAAHEQMLSCSYMYAGMSMAIEPDDRRGGQFAIMSDKCMDEAKSLKLVSDTMEDLK